MLRHLLRYLLRRIFTGLILAVLVTLITYFLLAPSFDGIVGNRLGPGAGPDAVREMKAQLGLDRPLIVQYLDWLEHAVRGDFGVSFDSGVPVQHELLQRLAVTLSFVVVALAITTLAGIGLGVLAASRGGFADRLVQIVSLSGYLVPNLLIAIGLVYLFAIRLHVLPATGFTSLADDPAQWAKSITIPVIALTVPGVAGLTAQVRGAMIDELRKDYVRTLRTRGVATWSVVARHALRNAAGPALTVLSFEFVAMLGGALIIEKVFAISGFGSYAFDSSVQGDVPAVMGVTLFAVLLVVTVNLAVDLVNGWLNPKARIF